MVAILPKIIKLKSKNKNNNLSIEKTSHIHILFSFFNNLFLLSFLSNLSNWGRTSLSRSSLSRGQSFGQLLEFVISRESNGHKILESVLNHMRNRNLIR
jgi:hypothetical protein